MANDTGATVNPHAANTETCPKRTLGNSGPHLWMWQGPASDNVFCTICGEVRVNKMSEPFSSTSAKEVK